MPEPAPEVRREILPAKPKPRAPDPGAHPSKKNLYVSRRSAKKSAQMIQNVKRRDRCRDYKQHKNAVFRKIDVVCKNAILEGVAEWRRTYRSEGRRRAARIFEAFTDSSGRIFQLGIIKREKILTSCV